MRVEIDETFVCEWISDAFSKITGYSISEAQLAQTRWPGLLQSPDVSQSNQCTSNLLRGETCECDFRIATKSGQTRWIRDVVRPVWDEDAGRVVRVYGAAKDITERKLAEERMSQRLRLYALLGRLGEAVVRADDIQGLYQNACELAVTEGGLSGAAVEVTAEGTQEPATIAQHGVIKADLAASASFPMAVEGTYAATLLLYSDRQDFFDADSRALIEELTSDICFAVSAIIQNKKRLAAEEALRESEDNYHSLINSIEGIVWSADATTFQFTFVSEYAEKLLGYPAQQWIDEPAFWADHVHPDDKEWAIAFCVEQTAALEPHDFEYRIIAADGRTVWLRDIVTVVADDQGKPSRLRGVMIDISEQKAAEEEIRRKDNAIRQAYIDVLDAVTGGRLIIMTPDEVSAALGKMVGESIPIRGYEDLGVMRAALADILQNNFQGFDQAHEVICAAGEAAANTVKHAGGGSMQVRRYKGGPSKDKLQIVINDQGEGIDFKILPKATLLSGFSTKKSLGIGFSIMLEMADRVLLSTDTNGTTLVIEKSLMAAKRADIPDVLKYALD